MVTITFTPESAASSIASSAKAGGTKITAVFAPAFTTASLHVLNTGTLSSNMVPPLPGVTPATTLVPYSIICLVWNEPSEPVMPCTINLVFLFTKTLMNYTLLIKN